jgi:PKD domain
MRGRGFAAAIVAACLMMPVTQAGAAHAAGDVVQLNNDSATLDTFQFVDDAHQASADADGSNFLTFSTHRGPATSRGLEGTAAGFVSEATTMETPGQPPFPLAPINDVAMDGTSTSRATATGKGAAVPVADSDGSMNADITTTAPVAVFFSGFIQTANTDTNDSCSSVTVDLTGGGADRHFSAFTGDCSSPGPHQKGWAESMTLAANSEVELDVEYSSAVDDALPGDSSSESGSATVSLNLAFFPPTARFSHTVSGFTGSFDGSKSSAGAAGHHLAKWEWSFGDGTTATTTSPKVSHTYPRSPTGERTYAVTLQVVDADGSISPTARSSLAGTAVTARVKKKPATLAITATIAPNRRGRSALVELDRRKGGRFRTVETRHPRLSGSSHLSTTVRRQTSGRCRLTVRYPGDASHLASERVSTFRC